MKRFSIIFLTLILVNTSYGQLKVPGLSPHASFTQSNGITKVSIDYSRPSKRGREIFGALVPYGQYWRTGANGNTKITFSEPVNIEGQELAAGSYSLFTKPGRDQWEIIFYDPENTWGSFANDPDKVTARINAKVTQKSAPSETFTIALENVTMDFADLVLSWDDVEVAVKLGFNDKEQGIMNVDKLLAGPGFRDYYNAAMFYNTIEDKDKVKEYLDVAIATSEGQAAYYMYGFQAEFYKELGDLKVARQAAEKAMKRAEEAKNENYTAAMKEFLGSL